MREYLPTIRKALAPVVAGLVAAGLNAIGVDLPGNEVDLIAGGIITSVFVWAVPNEPATN